MICSDSYKDRLQYYHNIPLPCIVYFYVSTKEFCFLSKLLAPLSLFLLSPGVPRCNGTLTKQRRLHHALPSCSLLLPFPLACSLLGWPAWPANYKK